MFFFLSAQSCLPEMVGRRDVVLEKSSSCRRPGGGGSKGSLIPTLRAPADLRAPEPTGSAWPERLPSSSRKNCLCVQSRGAGEEGRLLLPSVGACREGLGSVPPDFFLSSRSSAPGLSALTHSLGRRCESEEEEYDEGRRDAWKEKQKEGGLLGWHRHFSPRRNLSPSLPLSFLVFIKSCDGSSCLPPSAGCRPRRSHQAIYSEIPKYQSQHFQELLQNSPGYQWMRAHA